MWQYGSQYRQTPYTCPSLHCRSDQSLLISSMLCVQQPPLPLLPICFANQLIAPHHKNLPLPDMQVLSHECSCGKTWCLLQTHRHTSLCSHFGNEQLRDCCHHCICLLWLSQ